MDTGFPDGDAATITLTLPGAEGVHAGGAAAGLGRRRLRGEGERRRMSSPRSRACAPAAPADATSAASRWSAVRRAQAHLEVRRHVELALPKSLRLEPTPTTPRAAIMWGPLALAGDLGSAPRAGLPSGGRAPGRRWSSPVAESRLPADGSRRRPASPASSPARRRRQGPATSRSRPSTGCNTGCTSAISTSTRPAGAKKWPRSTVGRERQRGNRGSNGFRSCGPATGSRARVQPAGGAHGGRPRVRPATAAGPAGSRSTCRSRATHSRTCSSSRTGPTAGGRGISTSSWTASRWRRSASSPRATTASSIGNTRSPLAAIPQGTPKVTVRFQATGGNDIAAVFGLRVVRK